MSGTASQFGGTSGFCMSSTVHLKEWVNTLRLNGAKDCCPGSMAASHQSRETQGCSEFAVPFPFTRPYNIPGRHFDEGSPHPTNQMFYLSRQALHHRPQPTPIKEQHRSPMREEPLPPQGNDHFGSLWSAQLCMLIIHILWSFSQYKSIHDTRKMCSLLLTRIDVFYTSINHFN
jgi:hypothetical protein